MKIVYTATTAESGMVLSVDIINSIGEIIITEIPIAEVSSSVFVSDEILTSEPINRGTYILRVRDEDGIQRGLGEFSWDGIREVTKDTIDKKLWTEREKMQLRDAQGVDGDKMVARNGQLQKKSEAPYNNTIDTNDIYNK